MTAPTPAALDALATHQFAVTIGMDALRLAVGMRPKAHDAETILRWLRAMAERLQS